MSETKRLAVFALVTALGVVAAARGAPAPKDKPAEKRGIDVEVAVEPVEATKQQEARNREDSGNRLKQIGLAVHNYSDINNGMLPADIKDKAGKPLLSWRVLLLPYLEQEKLFKEFKLDEPWDSASNLKLLEKMPSVYASPRAYVKKNGYTVYQGFAGPGALFDPKQRLKLFTIPDGTANTIFAVESSVAVPWTKPADIPFDPKKDVPDFGKPYGGISMGLLCDGSVRTLNTKHLKPQTLKNAIMTSDGNVLGNDW